MYCKHCGTQLTDGQKYCQNCGAPVEDPFGFAEAKRETIVNNENDPNAIDKGSIGWGILGFFFPLIGLILYLVWRTEKPNSAKMAGIGALVSVIVSVATSILWSIVSFVFGVSILGGIAALITGVL